MKTPIICCAVMAATIGAASAASISMNLIENSANQIFAGGQNIGPLGTDSTNWNSSSAFDGGGSLANGTISTVIDSAGATVAGASISWGSSNVYYNGAGTGNDQQKLFVGYLDDGGSGATFTIAGHGYALYDLYVLATGDGGSTDPFTHTAFTVDGVAGANYQALGYNESTWVEAVGGTPGNYVKFSGLTAASLTVSAGVRDGANRGPINGFIIVQVPEPSTALLGGLGMLAFLRRRRR